MKLGREPDAVILDHRYHLRRVMLILIFGRPYISDSIVLVVAYCVLLAV